MRSHRYYRFSGLTPEDAGVHSMRLLSRSEPGVVMLVPVGALLLAAASTPGNAVVDARRRRLVEGLGPQDAGAATRFFASSVIVLVVLVYLGFFSDAWDMLPSDPGASGAYSGAVYGAVGGVVGVDVGMTSPVAGASAPHA